MHSPRKHLLRAATFAALFSSVIALSLPAFAEEFTDTVTKKFAFTPGSTLSLNAEYGSVEVVNGSGNEVVVEVTRTVETETKAGAQKIFDDFELTGTPAGGGVNLVGKFKQGWKPASEVGNENHRHCHSRRDANGDREWNDEVCLAYAEELREQSYRITLPKQASVKLLTDGGHIRVGDLDGEVVASTAGGHVALGNISRKVQVNTAGGHIQAGNIGGEARLKTAGGHIEVGEVNGPLLAETAGGHIHAAGAKGNVKAHTAGGHIEIEHAQGAVVAQTVGGHVRVNFDKQPTADSDIETTGGGIEVGMAPGLKFNVEAEANGGSVRSDFPIATAAKTAKPSAATTTDSDHLGSNDEDDDGNRSDGGYSWGERGRHYGPPHTHVTGTLNGGGPKLRLRDSFGSIRIESMPI